MSKFIRFPSLRMTLIAVIATTSAAQAQHVQNYGGQYGGGLYGGPQGGLNQFGGRSYGSSSFGYPQGSFYIQGYTPGLQLYSSPSSFHNTTHYDYHAPSVIRHGGHLDIQRGHYDLHQSGHWHR